MDQPSARIRFARGIARGDSRLRLYAILDAESCARRGLPLAAVAQAWRDAGVGLMQYRDKTAAPQTVLANAHMLRRIFPTGTALLLLNDHAALVEACDFDGVHVGQTDTAVAAARGLIGPDRILGLSTHHADEALQADAADVDYVAIGPVYATTTKLDAEPAVGLCGVQAARAVVRKPLVAIGGIGPGQAREVLRAGAYAVALISALLPDEADPTALTRRAQDILAGLK